MKLTLRDLLWLMLLISALIAWGLDELRAARAIRRSGPLLGSVFDHDNFHTRESKRATDRAQFAQMSDDQLGEYFESLPSNKLYRIGNVYNTCHEFEPCLSEMALRGLADQLQKHYDALMAQSAGKSGFDFPENLEMLTALRRAQRNSDPLLIQLSFQGKQSPWSKYCEPHFSAVIENIDSGSEAVCLQQGGDYRGGRLDRWRFELTDEKGQVFPGFTLGWGGGGIASQGPLQYRQKATWSNQYRFDLRSYLAPPPSGRYQLQAFYHNDDSIADQRDVNGLIVSKSDRIWVDVHSPFNAAVRRLPIPMPIAASLGCLVMTALSAIPSTRRLFGVSRRDFHWGIAIVAMTIVMWLSDGLRAGSNRRLPDQLNWPEWSIRLADDA